MKTFYVYKTQGGTLKISEEYCAHEYKISAKTLSGAKVALSNLKKKLKKDGE